MSKLIEKAKKLIRKDFANSEQETLPALKNLETSYRISIPILSKACQELREEGFLEGSKGQRYRLKSAQSIKPLDRINKTHRVAADITQAIEKGNYLAAKPLPGLKVLARLHDTSISTIVKSLELLIQKKLIVSYDRKYYVGTKPESRKQKHFQPTIIFIEIEQSAWMKLQRTRIEGFIRNFIEESIRYQCALIKLECNIDQSDLNIKQKFQEQIKNSGFQSSTHHVIGSILIGDLSNSNSLQKLITEVTHFTSNVLYLGRREINIVDRLTFDPIIECAINESESVKLALKQLHETGHQCIAFPSSDQYQWLEKRQNFLEVHSKALKIKCIDTKKALNSFNKRSPESLLSDLESIKEKGKPWQKKCARYFLSLDFKKSKSASHIKTNRIGLKAIIHALQLNFKSPTSALKESVFYHEKDIDWDKVQLSIKDTDIFFPFIWEKDVTAFIFPRDRSARSIVSKFKKINIHFPEDISAISFDNELGWALSSINSIDHGISDLGYRAFHFLLKDIPIGLKKGSNKLIAFPKIVDYGSVRAL